MARLIRVCECSGNDAAEFADVAHVNAAHRWIKRKGPAQGAVRLLLRSHRSRQVLVVEGRDHERVIRKSGAADQLIDSGLAAEVRNVELAAADRFHVRQR